MANPEAFRQILGTYGSLYWNGIQLGEVMSFKLTAKLDREDQMQANDLVVDTKLKSVKYEGTFKLKQVYDRGVAALLTAIADGKDPRATLYGVLKDPDALGSSRVNLRNVWFTEVTFMDFELGKAGEKEYPFGCTIVEFPDTITDPNTTVLA